MFGAKSRKHLSWTLCFFYMIHSSGSPWLLNAVIAINDSSRRMDWPWCSCFVKETSLCAPTLNLWLTQLYILTHAHALNIKRAASYDWNLSISWCDSVVGVDKSCIFAVFQGILVLCGTIYANKYSAKYTAKIDSSISGLLFKYVTWS